MGSRCLALGVGLLGVATICHGPFAMMDVNADETFWGQVRMSWPSDNWGGEELRAALFDRKYQN
jgi:hypothetical protein